MHSFPLLSEAYVTALLRPNPDPEPEEQNPRRARAPRDEEPVTVATCVEDEDDMETARTRPLRLDRIHL
jgi:hypothetical protein